MVQVGLVTAALLMPFVAELLQIKYVCCAG
jgi:hypothetical protein